jgi:predicted restriction endonuclease
MEPVIDAAVDALRRLADVVRGKTAGVTLPVDPSPTDAERSRRLAEILVRPAQQLLRRQALDLHGACVITGETEPAALEAAHIRPVYEGGPDTMDNVLLLRADLHRLFDAGLLTIVRGRPPCVLIAGALLRPGSDYATLATVANGGRTIGEAQWLALDTRNHAWDPDRGLTQTVARKTRSPLLVPSLHHRSRS